MNFLYSLAGIVGFVFLVAMLEVWWTKAHERRIARNDREFASRMSVAAYNKYGPCAPQCLAECDGACAGWKTRIVRDDTQ